MRWDRRAAAATLLRLMPIGVLFVVGPVPLAESAHILAAAALCVAGSPSLTLSRLVAS
jgi:hypothetical protein